jgi:acyl-CoA synthetase (AMP-forming)/AMP-acid ligase II
MSSLPSNLFDALEAQATRDKEAIAILAPDREPLTFGVLLNRLAAIRGYLNGYGLSGGDRIALLAERGADTAEIALGIACCAVCIPLNGASPLSELERALVDTSVTALVIPAPATAEIKDLTARLDLDLFEHSTSQGDRIRSLRTRGGRRSSPMPDTRIRLMMLPSSCARRAPQPKLKLCRSPIAK